MQYITINPAFTESPTRYNTQPPSHLPEAKKEKQHPSKGGGENASVYFIGTATTILWVYTFLRSHGHVNMNGQGMGGDSNIDWCGFFIISVYIDSRSNTVQPNFLHAGDHVHLGPGVPSTRRTNPAVDLHDLPRIDLVLLSHYHEYTPFPTAPFWYC